jgi:hypothetical protein
MQTFRQWADELGATFMAATDQALAHAGAGAERIEYFGPTYTGPAAKRPDGAIITPDGRQV